jgi:threonine dehydratase
MSVAAPDIKEIRALRERLTQKTILTPVVRCAAIEDVIGGGTQVVAKMEFLQRTGTFKARGALATLHSLTADQLQRGVTAVSAGNHAMSWPNGYSVKRDVILCIRLRGDL